MSEFVSTVVADGVATLVLSRPPTNALTRQMYREIAAAAGELGARPEVGTVIVFGGHEVFSAGDDVAELRRLGAADAESVTAACRAALDAVAAIPKPTVAAVTGYALGSGLALALAADWRIAGDNVKVGVTEALAGLLPAAGTERLVGVVGAGRAKELVFSGRFVGAEEALALGLVDELVAPDGVYDAALGWARRHAEAPAHVLAGAKAMIDSPGEAVRRYVEVFGTFTGS
ncbi:enoyl-CoA hydratase [Mycolicibacterium diernhoferi]|uniref:Enoyl-CoA hydratase n=1 Tax=Mycolicibacterium diernhoferi TaxID=1801 RepID=A0A1Q4HH57_9MYCO|nr:enoyl-CoA hydratase [Mycolicibacterium diernhoferi]OJZ66711.1 enoyl-CoA hydratase [Mycolicibacterium diernhoferi]OPE45352.1 enoyl-CoA hydratase [Mycolicibacterium diernhoferi]PEG56573.1 enoyl-CoA hydratase [Mycolicibacterium diernhoferi]QYL24629.1 enoyl-CoA hydratase [Mycolicibacterium diernhoferi]